MLNWHFILHSLSKIKFGSILSGVFPYHICSHIKSSHLKWHYLEETTGLSDCRFLIVSLVSSPWKQEKLSLTGLLQHMFIVANTDRRTRNSKTMQEKLCWSIQVGKEETQQKVFVEANQHSAYRESETFLRNCAAFWTAP